MRHPGLRGREVTSTLKALHNRRRIVERLQRSTEAHGRGRIQFLNDPETFGPAASIVRATRNEPVESRPHCSYRNAWPAFTPQVSKGLVVHPRRGVRRKRTSNLLRMLSHAHNDVGPTAAGVVQDCVLWMRSDGFKLGCLTRDCGICRLSSRGFPDLRSGCENWAREA
jgi:hypothetical protein